MNIRHGVSSQMRGLVPIFELPERQSTSRRANSEISVILMRTESLFVCTLRPLSLSKSVRQRDEQAHAKIINDNNQRTVFEIEFHAKQKEDKTRTKNQVRKTLLLSPGYHAGI
jgi:hypothetical protein